MTRTQLNLSVTKFIFSVIDSPPDGTEPAKVGYTLVFDNASQMMHDRYNRGNKGNKELKMVKAYAAFDRVPSYLLSDTPPTANDILRIDPQVYLPNDSDETLLRYDLCLSLLFIYIHVSYTLMHHVNISR